MSFTPIHVCRSCGGADLFPVLDLAEQPLANAFRSPSDTSPESLYPLALVGCRQCSLVQLTGSVTPGVMFDDYSYFSSFSDTMVAAEITERDGYRDTMPLRTRSMVALASLGSMAA